ncbi:MAG: ammonium transporter [bacterium]|nr:ammonium transporter [bacterium]
MKLVISKYGRVCLLLFAVCALAAPAFAQEAAAEIDPGDTAWLLVSTAFVIMMTAPGLALFYGGLVSHRNVLSTLMHSFFALCLISIQWVLWGYSLSFGSDIGGLIGGGGYLGFMGVGMDANGTIPHLLFAMFQCTFAVITFALISGAIAERMNFAAYAVFMLLWTTIVYDPLCHWVWGGGWLGAYGALDFAGGTVVHISSGVSALVACMILGPRIGFPESIKPPHSIVLTLIGAALLWVGWFGFNAGSALAANGTAALAFATTHTAAAMAGLTWALIEWAVNGKPTLLGCATGAVAGLVGITPAAGFVEVLPSIVIGAGAAIVSFIGVNVLKTKFGYDDSLDVFGVHGLSGTWGAMATGVFATVGAEGLIAGNPQQVWIQFVGVVAGAAWAGIGSFIILKVMSLFMNLRVSELDEVSGLDLSVHGEVAYNYTEAGMSPASHYKE